MAMPSMATPIMTMTTMVMPTMAMTISLTTPIIATLSITITTSSYQFYLCYFSLSSTILEGMCL